MKIEIHYICSQVYLIPFIKITHDRFLNGNYEIIFGWINKQIVISF